MTLRKSHGETDLSHLPTNFFYDILKKKGIAGYHQKVEGMMLKAGLPNITVPLGAGKRISRLWETAPAKAWLQGVLDEYEAKKAKPARLLQSTGSAISDDDLKGIRRDVDTIAAGLTELLKAKSGKAAANGSLPTDVAIMRQDVLAVKDQLMGIQELLTHMEQAIRRQEATLDNVLDVVTAPTEHAASAEPPTSDLDAALEAHDDAGHHNAKH